ncbi:MAG TPA: hypothetical protein VHL80_01100 [Polyangia bacterium]|nr:hypothetical protein [Polyangia bacterium]
MPDVLIVHGMRMPDRDQKALHATWYRALRAGLRQTDWGRAYPDRIPKAANVAVAYWADLFRGPEPEGVPKRGLTRDELLAPYYALLRGTIRVADALSMWDEQGRPRGPVAHLVNRMVHESARYMNNGSVTSPDPAVPEGAYFQVQARFRAALTPRTRLVLGHSLGSVIAYEGLCVNPHQVDTFVTVGSPIATPQLIVEPLLERLGRLLNRPDLTRPPWPGVLRWTNFYAPADVWSVPVKRLRPAFHPDIVDVEVHHGTPHRFLETHKLVSYLKHPELCEEIARGLDASWGS